MSAFEGAQNFMVKDSNFVQYRSETHLHGHRSGLQVLLRASVPEAAHDSSARDPPPRCCPGTREKYVHDIIEWTKGAQHFPMLWVHGPAGVGKSAVAQTCAERIGPELGAAFFFSPTNRRNNSTRLFTSIAYQLSTTIQAYRDHISAKIILDPCLVSKSMQIQFQRLIIEPFQELSASGVQVAKKLIIIDGLDECKGDQSQCNIIRIVAASARDRKIPLVWAFFSRPEPHIASAFSRKDIISLRWQLPLPVTREADGEIELFLRKEFVEIRRRHNIPGNWPSDTNLRVLVNLSSGLFIYASTVIKFIGEPDCPDPEEHLQAVLSLAEGHHNTIEPLSRLDLFYTLIMRRIPRRILPLTQRIFLVHEITGNRDAASLGIMAEASPATFYSALDKLHSVVGFKKLTQPAEANIMFYHRSFREFLSSAARSGKYGVWQLEISARMVVNCMNVLENMHQRQGPSGYSIPLPAVPKYLPDWYSMLDSQRLSLEIDQLHGSAAQALCLCLVATNLHSMEAVTLQRLRRFDYLKIITYPSISSPVLRSVVIPADLLWEFNQHAPKKVQNKIIRIHEPFGIVSRLMRRWRSWREGGYNCNLTYAIGEGSSKTFLKYDRDGQYQLSLRLN